jgi:aldose 1-epimerase
MTCNDTLVLESGRLRVALAPAVGGSIARFDLLEAEVIHPVLRGAEAGERDVLRMGCFPLVPYCNRIRNGRFHFRGREVAIRPNMAGDPSPLHGQGWQAPWTVVRSSGEEAVLRFHHPAGEWPWDYEAEQRCTLDADGLGVTLSCRNLSDMPMPCGLGLHPYFPCEPETELDTQVEDVWTVDEDVLPVERRPATDRYDLRDRRICGQDLDNGFSGWSGRAEIRDPRLPFSIRVSSPNARYFQVYSPASGGLFVAEPVSHANAALNQPEERWSSLGLKVLESGETAILDARFAIVQTG